MKKNCLGQFRKGVNGGIKSETGWTKFCDLLREALRPLMAWAFSENCLKLTFIMQCKCISCQFNAKTTKNCFYALKLSCCKFWIIFCALQLFQFSTSFCISRSDSAPNLISFDIKGMEIMSRHIFDFNKIHYCPTWRFLFYCKPFFRLVWRTNWLLFIAELESVELWPGRITFITLSFVGDTRQ